MSEVSLYAQGRFGLKRPKAFSVVCTGIVRLWREREEVMTFEFITRWSVRVSFGFRWGRASEVPPQPSEEPLKDKAGIWS